jgi:spore coat polysaccharide biosynthesis protein SpsF
MRNVLIVQARMTSTRLPGKVLKPVLGKPLLAYQVERLRRVEHADAIVLATTTNDDDQVLVDFARAHELACYRGSDEDVLSRYHGAAMEAGADVVIRVTSDCPLIDPAVIDEVIAAFTRAQPDCDYVSNALRRTYPRGMDCEVFSQKALDIAHTEAIELADREHVTPFIYRHPARFALRSVEYASDQSDHRWTVDTVQDFDLVSRMLEHLYPRHPSFTLEDCLDLLAKHPDWARINANVQQKTLGQ